MSAAVVEIVTTVATEEDAVALARRLIEERLVACASFRAVRSIYPWQGEICDEPEQRLELKTLADRAPAVARRLAELHPYDVPMILRVPVENVDTDYGEWVRATVTGGEETSA